MSSLMTALRRRSHRASRWLAVKDDLGVERSHLSASTVLPESRMLDLWRSPPPGMTLPSRQDQRSARVSRRDRMGFDCRHRRERSSREEKRKEEKQSDSITKNKRTPEYRKMKRSSWKSTGNKRKIQTIVKLIDKRTRQNNRMKEIMPD